MPKINPAERARAYKRCQDAALKALRICRDELLPYCESQEIITALTACEAWWRDGDAGARDQMIPLWRATLDHQSWTSAQVSKALGHEWPVEKALPVAVAGRAEAGVVRVLMKLSWEKLPSIITREFIEAECEAELASSTIRNMMVFNEPHAALANQRREDFERRAGSDH